MDIVILSRIQFALSTLFHFLFAPLTMGLVILVAIMETMHVRTKKDLYRRMADFWGVLFTINYTLGVVTGIVNEFQFGTNWSKYSTFVGDIIGSPLAIEGLFAFFLESAFIGLWFFGRNRISPRLRAFSMWMVALGSNTSAIWIIAASGFMHHPVGYELKNGIVQLTNFWELVTNPFTIHIFFHTLLSSYTIGSFFVMAISAYHLLRTPKSDFYRISFRYGTLFALFSTLAVIGTGHFHGVYTAKVQPAKAAAFGSIWESKEDYHYPLILIPNVKKEDNLIEWLKIPYLGSLLYTNTIHGKVPGLKDFPKEDRPSVHPVFWSFRIMVGIGFLMVALSAIAYYLYRSKRLFYNKKFLTIMIYSLPLPIIATNLGWVVTEMGRQPWVVYGLMRTEKAVSPISQWEILFSLGGLVFFYSILITLDVYLLLKYARKNPEVKE